jgi:hypothetical protein
VRNLPYLQRPYYSSQPITYKFEKQLAGDFCTRCFSFTSIENCYPNEVIGNIMKFKKKVMRRNFFFSFIAVLWYE